MVLYNEKGEKVSFKTNDRIDGGTHGVVYRTSKIECLKVYKNNALGKIRSARLNPNIQSVTTIGGSRGGLVAVVSVLFAAVSLITSIVFMVWGITSAVAVVDDYMEENNSPELSREVIEEVLKE